MNEQFNLISNRLTDVDKWLSTRLSSVEEYVQITAKSMPKIIDMLTELQDDYYERKGLFAKQG